MIISCVREIPRVAIVTTRSTSNTFCICFLTWRTTTARSSFCIFRDKTNRTVGASKRRKIVQLVEEKNEERKNNLIV